MIDHIPLHQRIELGVVFRREICDSCSALLVPGLTCTVRIRSESHKSQKKKSKKKEKQQKQKKKQQNKTDVDQNKTTGEGDQQPLKQQNQNKTDENLHLKKRKNSSSDTQEEASNKKRKTEEKQGDTTSKTPSKASKERVVDGTKLRNAVVMKTCRGIKSFTSTKPPLSFVFSYTSLDGVSFARRTRSWQE